MSLSAFTWAIWFRKSTLIWINILKLNIWCLPLSYSEFSEHNICLYLAFEPTTPLQMHPIYNISLPPDQKFWTFPSVETILNCSNESFARISLKWFVSFVRKSVRILTRSCSVIWYWRISTSSISFRFILSEAAFKRLSTLDYYWVIFLGWVFDELTSVPCRI